ncbi:MAG: sigma-70 family RNA polymerase sigma factor [Planctomycetes bacterium]|nr:sigma-70 family RNA polymerase sigma factor [Planctomycetota bacterium]
MTDRRDADRDVDREVVRELGDDGATLAWLRRLARSLVRDESSADDVVQETCFAALGKGPTQPGAVRSWLAAVARNAARRMQRDWRRRLGLESTVARPEASTVATETSERLETARALLAAVEALDEPYRTAIRLRWLDGLAPREVAARLGVPPEVAWKRLSRGLSMLRARLDRDCGGRRVWLFAAADLGNVRAEDLPLAPLAAGALAAAATWNFAAGVLLLAACCAAAAAAMGSFATAVSPDVASQTGSSASDANLPQMKRAAPHGHRSPRARVRDSDENLPVGATGAATTATSAQLTANDSEPPADRIVGRVIGPGGQPVANAAVRRDRPGGTFGPVVRTGDDGRFVLPHPADGSKSTLLMVDESRFATVLSKLPPMTPGVVEAGDIMVPMRAPIAGRVVTPEGDPVAGAVAWLGSPKNGAAIGTSVVTGPDGSFRFDATGPGTWRVNVFPSALNAPHWLTPYVGLETVGGNLDLRVVVRLRNPGTARATIDFSDRDGRPLGPELTDLSAMVVSNAGFDDGRDAASLRVSRAQRTGSVTAAIDGLRPGDWLVWVRTKSLGPVLTPLHVDPWDTDVRLRVVATEPGRLWVAVEFPDGRVPESSAVIAGGRAGAPFGPGIWNPDLRIGGQLARQADGSYVNDVVAPGSYRLYLLAHNWCADVVPVEVVAGAIAEARLVARPGGHVRWIPSIPSECEAEIAFAIGDGEFEVLMETVGGTATPLWLPAFPPGRLRWRLRTARLETLASEGRVVATRQGEVTIVEGATVEIADTQAEPSAPR